MSSRKHRLFWVIGIILSAALIGLLLLLNANPYPVGAKVSDISFPDGPRDTPSWDISPSSYPSLKDYVKNEEPDLKSFTGSIVLNRPETSHNSAMLSFFQGELTTFMEFHLNDAEFARDVETLRAKGLAGLIKSTRNDWRIHDDGKESLIGAIDGKIRVPPSTDFGLEWDLVIEDGKIVSSERSLIYRKADP